MPAHNCAGIFLSLKSAPIHWQSSLHSIYGNILFCYCLMYVIINILRQSRRYYDCRPLKVAYSQMVKNTLPSREGKPTGSFLAPCGRRVRVRGKAFQVTAYSRNCQALGVHGRTEGLPKC